MTKNQMIKRLEKAQGYLMSIQPQLSDSDLDNIVYKVTELRLKVIKNETTEVTNG